MPGYPKSGCGWFLIHTSDLETSKQNDFRNCFNPILSLFPLFHRCVSRKRIKLKMWLQVKDVACCQNYYSLADIENFLRISDISEGNRNILSYSTSGILSVPNSKADNRRRY